jgi:deoxyadenosine/deoxycytidine kinase
VFRPVVGDTMLNRRTILMSNYIAIEGPIGVGKTTLAQSMQEKVSARAYFDGSDNPFLADFYNDQPGAAFRTQLYFLIIRFQQQRLLQEALETEPLVVSDYLFAKDKIFAYLNLEDHEILIYDKYFEALRPWAPDPDLVVYLQAPKEILFDRVRRRNVAFEAKISDAYVEELIKAYDHFFYHYKDSPLLIVNTAEIDFVHNTEDLKALLRRITSDNIRGIEYYHPVRRK